MADPASRAPGSGAEPSFFGQPRGLSVLFFAELWERFSFYGMRAILILFMTAAAAEGGLGFPAEKAGMVYGAYTALVYLMSVPGGWLADKFLGLRRAVFAGGVVILGGHVCLAIPSLATFYAGLGLVVLGTGLLKPNISALVGALYAPEDARRDAGFSIYYMGINLGAFFAPLAVGWLAQSPRFRDMLAGLGLAPGNSWHFGFGAAAVGMLAGLIWYAAGWKHLGGAGERLPENPESARRSRRILGLGLGAAGAVLAAGLILPALGWAPGPETLGRAFGAVLALTPLLLFAWLYFYGGFDAGEKKRLGVILVLFFGAAVFWSVFEQAGSTLNLFADRDTDASITPGLAWSFALVLLVPVFLAWRRAMRERKRSTTLFASLVTAASTAGIFALFANLGKPFPSSYFQSANALFIVALAPLFASLWTAWGPRQPSSPAKFAVGILFVALGFGILIVAARLAAQGQRVSPLWLAATYMLHTIGELCLSPVGMSAMTRLAPQRMVGLVLGIWFLAASLGNFLAGFTASFYERMPLAFLFATVTGVALAAAAAMAAMAGPMRRMVGRG